MGKLFPISGQDLTCLWSLLPTQNRIIQPLTSMTRLLLGRNRTANTWITKSEQASVGILFGDAGILKPRFVDNLTLYYVENKEYVAVEPTFIDYYIGNEPSLPRTQIIWIRIPCSSKRRIGALYQASEKCQVTRMKSFVLNLIR